MKILYVIEHISAPGGLERILMDKLNALSRDAAMDITLLTVWKDTDGPAYALDARVRRVCLGISVPSSAWGMLRAMPVALCRYNREVRRLAPDIVVYFRAMGAMLAAFSTWRGRSVFETHSARHYCNHRWLYPLMERRVDAVVCLTQGDARNYRRAARVEVIPNFTRLAPLTPAEVSRGRRRCTFMGRLCPEKDPMRLLRLWHRIVSRMPGWRLDIYGHGELEPEMREMLRRSSLSRSVTMHGFAGDIRRVYAGTDILLLTSVTEGLPMVVMEAMRCGVPVVSTDCPYGPGELILDGHTGMLVPVEDDEAYVDAVCRLMLDDGLRRRMGHEAMERSSRYSMEDIMGQWKHLFNDLT